LRAAERASFNEVKPRILEFALASSRQDAKRAEAACTCLLGLCVNLEEDDEDNTGQSQWRGIDGGQGYSQHLGSQG
jgi:hypothetical protein